MTTKALSLVTASGLAYIILQSQLHSDDALFLVVSGNLVINLGLGAIAGLAIYLSCIKKFRYSQTYIATAAAAIALCAVGFFGFAYSGMANYFGIIKPLDYVILLQLGIIFGLFSLSYKHPAAALNKARFKKDYLRYRRRITAALPKPVAAIDKTRKPRPA